MLLFSRWRMEKHQDLMAYHLSFENSQRSRKASTYNGNWPQEWILSGITPIPKKGDLTKTENHRGTSLTQVASINRCFLNQIRPYIDAVLRSHQNEFPQGRSTSLHIWLSYVGEFKKTIWKQSWPSSTFVRLLTLLITRKCSRFSRHMAYSLTFSQPSELCIKTRQQLSLYQRAKQINLQLIQGDPLAHFLFITCLDYVLGYAITDSHCLTLKRRPSNCHPADVLADLDYADNIARLKTPLNLDRTSSNMLKKNARWWDYSLMHQRQKICTWIHPRQLTGLLWQFTNRARAGLQIFRQIYRLCAWHWHMNWPVLEHNQLSRQDLESCFPD